MPIIKSAQKRMRQTVKRHDLNTVTRKNMRESIKALTAALNTTDSARISESLRKAQSAIDVAVKKNILHKNTASRRKSALSAKVKANGTKLTAAPAKKAASKTAAKVVAKKPAAKKAPAKKA